MQNAEELQKLQEQLDSLRLQLEMINSAAETAAPEEKLNWMLQRLDTEEAIAAAEGQLQAMQVSVVYSPDEADALLNTLLTQDDDRPAATEAVIVPPATDEGTAGTLDTPQDVAAAEAMLNTLLMQDEAPIAEDPPAPTAEEGAAEAGIVPPVTEEAAPEAVVAVPPVMQEATPEQIQPDPTADKAPVETGSVDGAAAHASQATQSVAEEEPSDLAELRARLAELCDRAEADRTAAQQQLAEAEADALRIRAEAEADRGKMAARMEAERARLREESRFRAQADAQEKARLAEKVARRKAEITALRNGLQNVADSDSAFALREKLFSIQTVLDEEERSSPEITYLIAKPMDDVSHALEVAELKRKIAALTKALQKPKKPPVKKSKPKAKTKKKAVAKAHRMPAPRGRRAPIGRGRPLGSAPASSAARRRPAPNGNGYSPRSYY